jgi:hypothetical protein
MRRLDPRLWNLGASVTLVAACGPTKLGASETDASTNSESTTEGTEPECQNDSDCPAHYSCEQGVCKYAMYDDGWFEQEGYYGDGDGDGDGDPDLCLDHECPLYSHCAGLYGAGRCIAVDPPSPPCEVRPILAIPLTVISGPALALAFVDPDGDGQDELAVVTATHIELFDNANDPPVQSLRGIESAVVEDAVAGEFDGQPGADLMLSIDTLLWLHSSDGASSFAAGTQVATPLATQRMIAGNYLEGPETELMLWNAAGAVAMRPGADPWQLTDAQVDDLTALDLEAPVSTILLRNYEQQLLFDFSGAQVNMPGAAFFKSVRLGSFTAASVGYHASIVGDAATWRSISIFEGAGADVLLSRAIPMAASELATGDLDGDGGDELVVWNADGQVGIELNPLDPNHCWWPPLFLAPGPDVDVVLGDFNGDGDDEIAARFGGQVELWSDG